MRAHLSWLFAVACAFFIGPDKAAGTEPVSYRQATALSAAERNDLNRKAERGDWQAAFDLALYYAGAAPNIKNREYFLTLASKSGSRESIEALADFYSMPGGVFQIQKAISLRRDLKSKFPNEIDNIDWAEGCAFEYHYLTTEAARRKELTFLKLAASWGSAKAQAALQKISIDSMPRTKAPKQAPVMSMSDSLRISTNRIAALRKKAERGDADAAERLSLYYGIYRNDKKREVRYLKLGAEKSSDIAIRNLLAIYSADPDLFNARKAFGLRRQLKHMAETKKIDVQPDSDWSYNLYIEHFFGAGNKRRGVYFLEYAAKYGSEAARNELIEIYSNDRDVQSLEKARYWKQRSEAAKRPQTQVLALISRVNAQAPAVVASGDSAEFIPVRILGKEGMIVPPVFLRQSGLPAEGFWMPTTSQLREVEHSLPTFLSKELESRPSLRELHEVIALEPKYRRQYVGMIENGRKVIWVNCIPQTSEEGVDPFANWSREIIDVSDGGSSFWGVVYDLEKHSFDKLILNGSA
jgi:hypothetical protein